MTQLDSYELIFGLLTVLFAAREFLRVWKQERTKPSPWHRKKGQPFLLRSRKLLALACLLIIAAGPVGYHSVLIVKQLNWSPDPAPNPLPGIDLPWLSERVIQT